MAASPLRFVALVTAAGRSERFGGEKKELFELDGRSVLDRALSPFLGQPGLLFLALTAPPGREEELRASLTPATRSALGERLIVTQGGASRRDSVRLGLEALAEALAPYGGAEGASHQTDETVVLVHDGARPWASAELVRRVAAAATARGAAIPIVPLVDSPKRINTAGFVEEHLIRSSLGGAQTPQGFRLGALLAAHRRAFAEGIDCTDDAELWARFVGPVAWVEGERENRKITFKDDLDPRDPRPDSPTRISIGEGWDLHRLAPGRRLMLGGLEIPAMAGEVAHSDGDVLLHAIIDALLGGAALGDIGTHFPPSDERWRDADSRELLCRALKLVRNAGWRPEHIDCTIIIEQPRLAQHREGIRASIASLLGMPIAAVSVKAKTSEGVNAVGEGAAVEARAIVLLVPVGGA